ncbi:MAG: DUF5110 domain-containing protein [Acidobacteriota bacterium]|nr:DUF5110 domain-containing protein [Acidobacteriota bacterium]
MRYSLNLLLSALLLLSLPCATLAQSTPPVLVDKVTSATPLHDGVEVHTTSGIVRITAQRDDILRIRIAASTALPEDASWAVLPASRTHTVDVQPQQDDVSVGFRTAALDLRVERDPLRIVVRDLQGNVLSADAPGRPSRFEHGGFTVYKQMAEGQHFFGLGDKTGNFDRYKQAYTLWNTDTGVQDWSDPIYKSIPFFLTTTAGRSSGLFLDNTWRTWFDFGKQARDAYAFGAEGGPLDYYFIAGPTPKQVVLGYIYLTGTPPLPPLWSLGFQQSRYSYTPESQLRQVADRLRADKIPADALYLDIDYQYRNRPFTVDPQTFPNFPGLVSDLAKQNFHLVTITDLHIAHVPDAGYAPYDSGHAGDHFIKRADGSEYVGVVWPGPAVFPDFTRQQTRAWWGNLYTEFVKDGVAGFWNDMNEPSVFDGPGFTMPIDNIHRIDEPGFATRTATHAEIHNILGMQNERATYDGLLRLRPNERPFVLTRATFAGGQRYGFTWTGDNNSTYGQLRLATQMLINLGLSGISFVGDDIGGFGGSANADLLTRWVEIGAFNPLFRDHSTKGSMPQELWVHGPEQEAIRRRYVELRYRLMPYVYTLAEEASRTGLPMVRPTFLEFPNDFDGMETEFFFGRSFLVVPPPFAEMPEDFIVSFPKAGWYDFWTGHRVVSDAPPVAANIVAVANAAAAGVAESTFPQPMKLHPQLDTLPVYVREGSIIPMQPLVQSTNETPNGPLELRVYPGEACAGSLYLDDGHTLNYQHGDLLRQGFSCTVSGDTVTVGFAARQGTYKPWWKSMEVVVYNWNHSKATATLSGSSTVLKTRYDAQAHALHVSLPDVAQAAELHLQ